MRALSILLCVVLPVAAIAGFAATIIGFNHNESMYVAAGYLVRNGLSLYRDFAYLQMPHLPLLYAALFKVTGTSHYLLTARLVSFTFLLVSALVLYRACAAAARDRVTAAAATLMFLLNPFVLWGAREASNYIAPCAFTLLAAHVFARRSADRPGPAFVAGCLLGVAVGMKLYYALLTLPFLVMALARPRAAPFRQRLARVVLPLAAGGLLGLAPALFYLARDPAAFLFDNLGYHLLNARWVADQGRTETMAFLSKIRFGLGPLRSPHVLLPALWLAAALAARAGGGTEDRAPRVSGFYLLLGLTSVAAAFAPRPLHVQYMGMPVPFLLIFAAAVAGRVRAPRALTVRALAVLAAFAVLACSWSDATEDIGRLLLRKDAWVPLTLHDEAAQVRKLVDEHAPVGKLATATPLVAVEAELPFYPELATGPFLFRVGDLLTGEQRRKYVATSPAHLAQRLDADPPAAIFTGAELNADKPFIRYARARGYEPVALGNWGTLYLRPKAPPRESP